MTTFRRGQRVRLTISMKNAEGFPGGVVPVGTGGTVEEVFPGRFDGREGYTVALDGDPDPDMPMLFYLNELAAE